MLIRMMVAYQLTAPPSLKQLRFQVSILQVLVRRKRRGQQLFQKNPRRVHVFRKKSALLRPIKDSLLLLPRLKVLAFKRLEN